MRRIVQIVLGLALLAALIVGGLFGVSEIGGEVVVLHTRDASGADQTTHLWVVDDGGFAWLRSGLPTSGWFVRLEANPDVVVERAGRSSSFRAVPVRTPEARDLINGLIREKYRWADRVISATRDGDRSIPVRLEPATAATP
jgi:hypothetical protein